MNIIYNKLFASHYTALAPTPCNNCCMRGLAACSSEYSLCSMHAAYIFRAGFFSDKDYLLASHCPLLCILCSKYNFAACSARHSIYTSCKAVFFQFTKRNIWINDGIEKTFNLFICNPQDCLFFCYKFFFYHVNCHTERCGWRPFTGTALKNVKPAIFNSKFYILHVSVMLFEFFSDIAQLLIYPRHAPVKVAKMKRRADARDNILSLGIHEQVAIEDILPCVGVSGETDACPRGIAFVSEYHLHQIDCGAAKP